MKFMRILCFITALVAVLAMTNGCTTVPVTGRTQLNLVSPSQARQLGLSEFDKLKRTTPIDHDPAVNAMVQKVGKRIAAVASQDMPDAQWEFVVFDSPEANAFCLPGGKVGVYKGILPITKNEAGLATVIGHEVGHAMAHHGAERMSEAMVEQGIGQFLGMSLSNSDPRVQALVNVAYGIGANTLVILPHSRAQESEADHIGLVYMARAGYDPREAVKFWERFMQYNAQHGGGGTLPFLRTHPTDEKRIQQLRQWLPEAEAQYQPAN